MIRYVTPSACHRSGATNGGDYACRRLVVTASAVDKTAVALWPGLTKSVTGERDKGCKLGGRDTSLAQDARR